MAITGHVLRKRGDQYYVHYRQADGPQVKKQSETFRPTRVLGRLVDPPHPGARPAHRDLRLGVGVLAASIDKERLR